MGTEGGHSEVLGHVAFARRSRFGMRDQGGIPPGTELRPWLKNEASLHAYSFRSFPSGVVTVAGHQQFDEGAERSNGRGSVESEGASSSPSPVAVEQTPKSAPSSNRFDEHPSWCCCQRVCGGAM